MKSSRSSGGKIRDKRKKLSTETLRKQLVTGMTGRGPFEGPQPQQIVHENFYENFKDDFDDSDLE
eukprot:gene9634-10649_t